MSEENLVQRIISGIRNLTDKKIHEERRYNKKHRWYGLVPGDLVEISHVDLLYMGLDRDGGPGMGHMASMGVADPFFTLPYPTNPQLLVYLRPEGRDFPMYAFGQNLPPAGIGNDKKVTFLNKTGAIIKLGHLTNEEFIRGEYFKRYSRRYETMARRLNIQQEKIG
jgi:hypothetical protein